MDVYSSGLILKQCPPLIRSNACINFPGLFSEAGSSCKDPRECDSEWFLYHLSPGQTDSQVDVRWKLWSTCDPVWPGLTCTCVDLGRLAHTLVDIKFASKSTQVYHRLPTQTKSTQVEWRPFSQGKVGCGTECYRNPGVWWAATLKRGKVDGSDGFFKVEGTRRILQRCVIFRNKKNTK